VGQLAEESLVKQFAYNPSALYKGLVSCVGSDYCNLAVIETKSRAVETARAAPDAQERVVQDVLGGGPVADDAQGDAEEVPALVLVEEAQSLAIAGGAGAQRGVVVDERGRGGHGGRQRARAAGTRGARF